MAARKKPKPSERTFPKGTPAWRRIDCELCGAKAGAKCRNLHSAVKSKLGPNGTNIIGDMVKPHDVRVRAAEKAGVL